MDQDPELQVTDAFSFFCRSGLTLGAFAARCGLSLDELLKSMAGLVGPKNWHQYDPAFRDKLFLGLRWNLPEGESLGSGTDVLYVATRGPRGSVRWHYWTVAWETLKYISEHAHEKELITFTTLDNLVVVLNPAHIVTMMYGGEDTGFLMEQVSVVPTQSPAGGFQAFGDRSATRREFVPFRNVVEKLVLDGEPLNQETLDAYEGDFPFHADYRSSRAWMVDLKKPFEDFYQGDVLDGQWHLWAELSDFAFVELPSWVTFADGNGYTTAVSLTPAQVTVLECPMRLIARFNHTTLLDASNRYDTPSTYRKDLLKLGLFSTDEVDEMVQEYRALPMSHSSPWAPFTVPYLSSATPKKRKEAHQEKAQPMAKSYSYLEKLKAQKTNMKKPAKRKREAGPSSQADVDAPNKPDVEPS